MRKTDEILKTDRRKLFPILGKKMVIIDVHQHRSKVAKTGIDATLAPQEELIAGGKGINLSVNLKASPDTGRKAVVEAPLDEIPHQVAHKYFRITARKKEMHQVVHDEKILARTTPRTQCFSSGAVTTFPAAVRTAQKYPDEFASKVQGKLFLSV
jgi:hypothetical protein